MNPTLHTEQQLLAICLTQPGAIRQLSGIIHKPETFGTTLHQRVYQAMLTLNDQSYDTDLVTVHNELLSAHGHLNGDPAGWMEMLTGLIPEADTFTSNLAKLAYWLVGEATRRTLMRICSRTLTDLQMPGSDPLTVMAELREKIEAVEGRLSELSETPFSDALNQAVQQAEQAALTRDPITGIRTGIDGLDMYLKGLHGSTMTILAARPGQGKTAQMCQIVDNIANRQRIPTAVFSLEMKRVQLARRQLAIDADMKNAEVLSGLDRYNEPIDIKKLLKSAGKLSDSPLFVYDNIFTLDHLVAKIRQLVISHGVQVVFIDYMQLIETNDRDDRVRVGRCSRKLKNLANELDIPIVVLAQLKRALEDRSDKRPKLSDLKESGSLEQDADNVIFLYCPATYAAKDENGVPTDPNLLYNIVAKNRNGSFHSDGEGIELHYDKSTNRIKSYQRQVYESF